VANCTGPTYWSAAPSAVTNSVRVPLRAVTVSPDSTTVPSPVSYVVTPSPPPTSQSEGSRSRIVTSSSVRTS
jgi:hypothetical protein